MNINNIQKLRFPVSPQNIWIFRNITGPVLLSEQITRDFCCIFYRFVDFLTPNTLTQLYLKNVYTFRTNIVSRSYRIIKGLVPTVIRIWLSFGQRSRFFARF